MNKRYTANNRQNLQIVIGLPAKRQTTITFISGYGLKREGYFITENEDLQKALEKDDRFNRSFRLSEVDNMSIAEYNANADIKKKKEQSEKIFKTIQEAKDWLNANYNVPYNKLGNKTLCEKEFKNVGLELHFENT